MIVKCTGCGQNNRTPEDALIVRIRDGAKVKCGKCGRSLTRLALFQAVVNATSPVEVFK